MDSSRFAPPADVEAALDGRIPEVVVEDVDPVPSNSQAGLHSIAELSEPAADRRGFGLLDLSA